MHTVGEFLLNTVTDINGLAGFTLLDLRRIFPMTAVVSGCDPLLCG